ncbi:MAG: TlpA family protein disulfide reductase [Pseudomonadota bacterium]|nr:MAG: TlpA family protein disulfide reductase [Pseudomonadota bacterium]
MAVLLSALCNGNASAASTGLPVGQVAPGFEIKSINGEPRTLNGLIDTGSLLVVFWSTNCHLCHALVPRLKKIHKEYHGNGLTVVAINVGYEDNSEVRRYAEKHGLEYTILSDPEQRIQIAETFRLSGTPTVMLVSTRGTIEYYGHELPDLSAWAFATE